MTHKEAMLKLIETIENEDNAFSIQELNWLSDTRSPADSMRGECGTPACILGWASELNIIDEFYSYLRKTFLSEHQTHLSYHLDKITAPKWECTLTGQSYNYHEHPEWFTRARTVAMLKNMMENKVINWNALEAVCDNLTQHV